MEGAQVESTGLWHNEEVTVRIVKRGLLHTCICTVPVYTYALLHAWFSSPHQRYHTLDEVSLHSLFHFWNRLPSQLVRMILNVLVL